MQSPKSVNVEAAADLAIGRQRLAFIVAVGNQAKHNLSPSGSSPVVHHPTVVTTVPTATSSDPWPCIATAETSGVAAMGPTYWTEFGMVTGIITEYGTPTEQRHVFDGSASYAEQLDIGVRFAADHGFGGWGSLTRQKCGL